MTLCVAFMQAPTTLWKGITPEASGCPVPRGTGQRMAIEMTQVTPVTHV